MITGVSWMGTVFINITSSSLASVTQPSESLGGRE